MRKLQPRTAFRRVRALTCEALEDRCLLAGFDVLVFSETTGFRHSSIDEGIFAILGLGNQHNFSVSASENSAIFTDPSLGEFEAIVFLNTTGTPLNPQEQLGFQDYIRAGGGFVGVHAASDTHVNWDWYRDLVGASFVSHPAIQSATIKVEDSNHPSTQHLPDQFTFTDEWYNFNVNPRSNVNVLATIDESSYSGGTMGVDHPISWNHDYDGGRSWYTNLGHREQTFSDSMFLDHLLGGIRYAAGVASSGPGGHFSEVVLETNVVDPISLEVDHEGRVFFVELGGQVRMIDSAMGSTSTIGSFNVDTGNEDGLIGLALDPNFATNGWIYFYYTPTTATHAQRVSRVTFDGTSLDMSSETIVLEFPADTNCCHTGGSLEFGPDGTLYISSGDDTNPFESSGHAPIDERAGRSAFDAQRTSGNDNDLRGSILRIRPEPDGTYSIPDGNLFPSDGSVGRPEIYVMGVRNPYRIAVDQQTGWLYWGDVGPDASSDSGLGPRGYDEFNQAQQAGNFGWPYAIADNKPYRDFDFDTQQVGSFFDLGDLSNDSPNNTGSASLPSAEPAWIWYPYATSAEFPDFGSGGRAAMAGDVYHFDMELDSDRKLPEYYDESLFVFDWVRRDFWQVEVDSSGAIEGIRPFLQQFDFARPIDMEVGPDGAVYIIEWGSQFGGGNSNAQIVRLDFQMLGPDFNDDGIIDGTDIDLLQSNIVDGPSNPAVFDLTGDGAVDLADRDVWLIQAGAINLNSAQPYLFGDANLDGIVDGLDFIDWNSAKFTTESAWTRGDFNVDGFVDGLDFIAWNENKFMSSGRFVRGWPSLHAKSDMSERGRLSRAEDSIPASEDEREVGQDHLPGAKLNPYITVTLFEGLR